MTLSDSSSNIKTEFVKHHSKKIIFLSLVTAAIILVAGISATLGSYDLSLSQVYTAILARIFPWISNPETASDTILWDIRLPRIVMAIVGGASLAIAGAVMQGVLKNPLADSYTLGISSAAAMGAALSIIFGFGIITGNSLTVVNAFFFSIVATIAVYSLAKKRGMTPESIILGGIAMMFLLNALTSLMQYLGTAQQVQAVVFWMMGSLSKANWDNITITTLILLVTLPYLIYRASDITILSAGDETAHSLGINVERTRVMLMMISALLTAGITAFTGIIGFIGLVSPHIVRLIIGGDNRYVLPGSALVGGLLLLVSDTVARTILAPLIIPVGIMTALIGVPFFVYLFLNQKKEYW